MGDKDTSRQLMQQVGVPVVPGTEVLKDVEEGKEICQGNRLSAGKGNGRRRRQGYPRGGERGRPADAFHTASREAERPLAMGMFS